MSRLEAKVERLTDQLASKERELQAITSKVFQNTQLQRSNTENAMGDRLLQPKWI